MKRLILAAVLIFGPGGLAAPPAMAQEAAIAVSGAWARPTIPTRPGAGYMTIRNEGESGDALLSAHASGVGKIQLHGVEEKAGVVGMVHLESLPIPAGGEEVLAPGGTHLMLMGLEEPLAPGTVLPVTLLFEKAGEIEVGLAVSREPPESHGSHGQSD